MKSGRSTLHAVAVAFLLTIIAPQPGIAGQDKLSKTQLFTHDPDIYDWLHDGQFEKIPRNTWYNRQLGIIMTGFTAAGCYSLKPAQRQKIGKRKALVLNMATEGEASDKPVDALIVLLPEVITLNTAYFSATAYLEANDGCNSTTVQQTLNNLIDLIIARGDYDPIAEHRKQARDPIKTGNLKRSYQTSIRGALQDELYSLEVRTGKPEQPIVKANRLDMDWSCCFVNEPLLGCKYSVGERHIISKTYHFWYREQTEQAIADVRKKELDENDRLSLFGQARTVCPATEAEARTLLGLEPRQKDK
jgi:hypothetical protein